MLGLRPDQIAHRGIGYVPKDRQIFPTLTVRQNLELGLKRSGRFGRWKFEDIYALFPNLGERQHVAAGHLSGGEQQMLAMSPGVGSGYVQNLVTSLARVTRARVTGHAQGRMICDKAERP